MNWLPFQGALFRALFVYHVRMLRHFLFGSKPRRFFWILNALTVGEEMHYLYSNTSRWRRNTAKALSARACISSSPG